MISTRRPKNETLAPDVAVAQSVSQNVVDSGSGDSEVKEAAKLVAELGPSKFFGGEELCSVCARKTM